MQTITGPGYRISVLTSRLLRLEWSDTDDFVDQATQLVLNREVGPEWEEPARVVRSDRGLELFTDHLHLRYDEKPFSPNGLSIQVLGNISNYHSEWRYGEAATDLGGTARTLDEVDGSCPLEPGLLSRNGFTVVDDSSSLLLTDDGWVEPRPAPGVDLYFFGYGRDYRACLTDYHRLTGPVPLLPRFALGNWWSRYHRYDAQGYTALMDRFAAEGIPFSVAVVDMDWHLTDIDPALGSGWTGFTWNQELFPDPESFLAGLHGRGLAVTLNLHPAAGVRRHEAAYPALAERLGVTDGDPVGFDVTSRDMMQGYFEEVLHPLERQGVDFWWLDWQQGGHSDIPGLDPLWMINHLHHRDSGRDDRRPITFSRYAGLGSHRTPIGFSGDTVVTWESLDFQPYFTATAANVGYGWWSHDIGGHFFGYRNDELATRWVQFGVFSPINRLHSGNNPFNSKEPWRFEDAPRRVMAQALRWRHQLVPYLYTMVHRASAEAAPVVEPLYHRHPEVDQAYEHPNQYFFGTQLLVAPITSPTDPKSRSAAVRAWLPPGTWYDLFTGVRYDGNRQLLLHRDLDSIPVLASAGAIIPLQPAEARVDTNPDELRFVVIGGSAGAFTLLEDDGTGATPDATQVAQTEVTMSWPRTVTVAPVTGATGVVPSSRTYVVELRGITDPGNVTVDRPSQVSYDGPSRTLTITAPEVPIVDGLRIDGAFSVAVNDVAGQVHRILDRAWIGFELKATLADRIRDLPAAAAASQVQGMGEIHGEALPDAVRSALLEVLLAQPH